MDNSEKKLRVLFITKSATSNYHKLVAQGAMDQAKQEDIALDVVAPAAESDYDIQKQYIIDAIKTAKYQAVMLAPNHSKNLLEEINALCDAHIKVIIIDTPIDKVTSSPIKCDCGYVGTNNFLGGQLAAKYIKTRINGGNIVVIRGIHSHNTSIDRENGFVDEISKDKKFKIIAQLPGRWLYNESNKVYSKILKENIKVDAVFAYSDPMALGVAAHYKSSKKRPIIVGYNGDLDAQQAILKDKMDASVTQTPETMGRVGLKKLKLCHKYGKKDQESPFLIPVNIITSAKTLTTLKNFD